MVLACVPEEAACALLGLWKGSGAAAKILLACLFGSDYSESVVSFGMGGAKRCVGAFPKGATDGKTDEAVRSMRRLRCGLDAGWPALVPDLSAGL